MADATADPFELFAADLQSDSFILIENAIKHTKLVSALIGPARTRDALFPLLIDFIASSNIYSKQYQFRKHGFCATSALIEFIASSVDAAFLPLLGGETHLPVLLDLSNALLRFPNTSVQKKAAHSLQSVFSLDGNPPVRSEAVVKETLKLLRSLSDPSSPVSAHLAAIRLFAPFYFYISRLFSSEISTANSHVGQPGERKRPKLFCRIVWKILREFVCSESCVVRLRAVETLIELIPFLDEKVLAQQIARMVNAICADFRASIRILAVNVCVALLENIRSSSDEREKIVVCVSNCSADSHWEMRLRFADLFEQIFAAASRGPFRRSLLEKYLELLTDREEKVVHSALKRVSAVFAHPDLVEPDLKNKFYLIFASISRSRLDSVAKEILSTRISSVLTHEGAEDYRNRVISMVESLLHSNNDLYGSEILKSAPQLYAALGKERFLRLFYGAITRLSNSNSWRNRETNVAVFECMASVTDSEDYEKDFLPLVVALFTDKAHELRRQACRLAWKLCGVYGTEWARVSLFPHFERQSSEHSYLYRLLPLYFLEEFGDRLGSGVIDSDFAKIMARLAGDRIRNVSEYAGRVIRKLWGVMESETRELLERQLESASMT